MNKVWLLVHYSEGDGDETKNYGIFVSKKEAEKGKERLLSARWRGSSGTIRGPYVSAREAEIEDWELNKLEMDDNGDEFIGFTGEALPPPLPRDPDSTLAMFMKTYFCPSINSLFPGPTLLEQISGAEAAKMDKDGYVVFVEFFEPIATENPDE